MMIFTRFTLAARLAAMLFSTISYAGTLFESVIGDARTAPDNFIAAEPGLGLPGCIPGVQ